MHAVAGNGSLVSLLGAFAGITLAEWGYVTALAVVALHEGGATAVGLVGLRFFFAAAGSLVASGFLNRHRSATVMTAVAAARAASVAATAVLAGLGAPLASLLVLVSLDGIVSSLYRPAQAALVPTLSRTPTELAATSAALSTVKTLSQAVGAVLGASLLAVVQPYAVFAFAAAVFSCAALLTVRLHRPAAPQASEGERLGQRLRDMAACVGDRGIRGIVVISGLRTFVRGMWTAIAVIASFRLLHAGDTGVGLLMLAAGVGAVLAVPLSGRLVERGSLGRPAVAALLTCGVPLAIIAGVPTLGLVLALVVSWGIGMAVADVATSSLLYRLVPGRLLPKATGAVESGKLAFEGLGGLLAPLFVVGFGVRSALVIAAVPLPLVVLTGRKTLQRTDAVAGERARLLRLLHAAAPFGHLDMVALETLAAQAVPVAARKGEEIVRQGDPGDRFYVIASGRAEVLVAGFAVSVLGPGQGFGERALLRDVPRTATVRALEPMELVALDREAFVYAATGEHAATGALGRAAGDGLHLRHRQRVDLLAGVSLLSHVARPSLDRLAETALLQSWPAGEAIIRRGEEGDRLYVLAGGRAEVVAATGPAAVLQPGDSFGDIAMLHGIPRTADVVASEPSVTLSLHRDDVLPALKGLRWD
jgi:CRP-like cAMP-binding protein/predicted MFS family arabinose efflux permease